MPLTQRPSTRPGLPERNPSQTPNKGPRLPASRTHVGIRREEEGDWWKKLSVGSGTAGRWLIFLMHANTFLRAEIAVCFAIIDGMIRVESNIFHLIIHNQSSEHQNTNTHPRTTPSTLLDARTKRLLYNQPTTHQFKQNHEHHPTPSRTGRRNAILIYHHLRDLN